jgi:hypothetical protein
MVEWQQQFFERRKSTARPAEGRERRQFADTHDELPPEVGEFAKAVDAYKIAHARKFVTLAELHAIITGLGYHK